MDNPLVTVFVPIYNAEIYLGKALESIVSQTYTNLDILLIDDGSTDRSVEIVNSFNDHRIRLIQNHENKGIPYTRNIGLQEAKGNYMAVMDADDIALINRIEKQVEFMEQHPDIDVLGSFYETFGGTFKRCIKEEFNSPEEIKIALLFFSPIANPSAFIRLEKLHRHRIQYNPNYFVSQDYDMWVQLSKIGKLYILPEVLLKYRTGHTNITKRSKTNHSQQRKQIISSIHQDILNHYNIQLTKEELEIFNAFFTDNPEEITTDLLHHLSNALTKIKQQNISTQAFDENLLLMVIKRTFFRYLCNQKLSLLDKIRLYNQVQFNSKGTSYSKDISYLIIKHMYRAVR